VFPVPYEWGRLGLLVGVTAATVAAGELLLPTDGVGGLASRTGLWLALPLVLLAAGFPTASERAAVRGLLSPAAVRARLAALASTPAPREAAPASERGGPGPEVYEQATRDEDRLGG
jgi:hypothetical protein